MPLIPLPTSAPSDRPPSPRSLRRLNEQTRQRVTRRPPPPIATNAVVEEGEVTESTTNQIEQKHSAGMPQQQLPIGSSGSSTAFFMMTEDTSSHRADQQTLANNSQAAAAGADYYMLTESFSADAGTRPGGDPADFFKMSPRSPSSLHEVNGSGNLNRRRSLLPDNLQES